MSAESVGGTTAGVRVTWSTTVPPECVASVRVEFRTRSRGPVVATNTTTNTSQTEFIQTGLQCGTSYCITVVLTGETSYNGLHPVLRTTQVQVFTGGKLKVVCMHDISVTITWWWLYHCTDIPNPVGVRAEVTADNTSIRVLWSHQGVPMCVDHVGVHYQPEGGSLMRYTVDNTTATSATLSNLQCNTEYTIWVLTRSGGIGRGSPSRTVSLPARSMCTSYVTAYSI